MKRNGTGLGAALAVLSIGVMLVVAVPGSTGAAKKAKGPEFTDDFPLAACGALVNSTSAGARNRYFPLEVGSVRELSNETCFEAGDCDELEEVRVSVLDETETVDGVATRVVEEREWVDGALAEVSRNFFVECLGTEDVYYFGEDVVDGEGNPLGGAWRAGLDGARAGIIFPGGAFLLGARYFQEVAPGVALDRAEHKAMGLAVSVTAGEFSDCVLVEDTNALDDPMGKNPDAKVYCPGTGLVMDEALELTGYSLP